MSGFMKSCTPKLPAELDAAGPDRFPAELDAAGPDMKAVSRWLDILLIIDLLAHFRQVMCMHLGNHYASSEVHNPHLETSFAPFGSCQASFNGRRAFRLVGWAVTISLQDI